MYKKRIIPKVLFASLVATSFTLTAYSDWYLSLKVETDYPQDVSNEESTCFVIDSSDSFNKKYFRFLESAFGYAESGDVVITIPPTQDNYFPKDEFETSDSQQTTIKWEGNNYKEGTVNGESIARDKVEYHISKDCEIKDGVTFILGTDAQSTQNIESKTNLSDLNSSITDYINTLKKGTQSTEGPSIFYYRNSDGTYALSSAGAKRQLYNFHNNLADSNEEIFLRQTLYIDENTTLINNGQIIVSGILSGGGDGSRYVGQTSHSYSQIILDKNAKIIQGNETSSTSNQNLYIFGYIKEDEIDNSSTISIYKGNVWFPFIIRDYRGLYSMIAFNENGFDRESSPFNEIEFRNIEPRIYIFYNASAYGMANIYLKYQETFNQDISQDVKLLGNDSTSFIQFYDKNYSYFEGKYNIEKNSLLTSDKVSKFDFYGGFIANTLSIKMSINVGINVPIDVSTDELFFPLSYRFLINLHKNTEQESNAIYNIERQKLKIMPGSQLIIHENCNVSTNDITVYSAYFDKASDNAEGSLISNRNYPTNKEGGLLEILDNSTLTSKGSLGGAIYTNDETKIRYQNYNYTVNYEGYKYGRTTTLYEFKNFQIIKEQLNIYPISYIDKKKLYVFNNIMSNYETFNPKYNYSLSDDLTNINTQLSNNYNLVLFPEDYINVSFEPLKNIYLIQYYNNTTLTTYNLDSEVNLNNVKNFCVTNSTLEILANENKEQNEFYPSSISLSTNVDQIEYEGEMIYPLLIDGSIQVSANVPNIDKVYDKKVQWTLKQNGTLTSISSYTGTHNENVNLSGLNEGEVEITASLGDKTASIKIYVLKDIPGVVELNDFYIQDSEGNTSNDELQSDDWGSFQALYKITSTDRQKDITFTVSLDPLDASINNIKWTNSSIGADLRLFIDPDTNTTLSGQSTIEGKELTSITIRFKYDLSTQEPIFGNTPTPDYGTITCTITPARGESLTKQLKYEQNGSGCFEKGTLILTKFGYKKVEDLNKEDFILSYNHFTNSFEYQPINIVINHGLRVYEVMNLYFDDGTSISFIQQHGLYNITKQCYSDFRCDNYFEFIGDKFIKYENGKIKQVVLIKATTETKITESFTCLSRYNLNCITNGLLTTASDLYGLYDIFKYKKNSLQYDEKDVEESIHKYGLYEFKDFEGIVTEDIFENYGMKYFKISIGKGLMTYKDLIRYIEEELYGLIEKGEAPIH